MVQPNLTEPSSSAEPEPEPERFGRSLMVGWMASAGENHPVNFLKYKFNAKEKKITHKKEIMDIFS